jgi:hypothetical protein
MGYLDMELSASTYTSTPRKWSEDYDVEEFMTWVRYAKTDKDAMWNIKKLLQEYDSRKTLWQRIKAVLTA